MPRPDPRGSFRARLAYVVRALETGRGVDDGPFEGCFECWDGAALVCALLRERPDLSPYGLTPYGLEQWRATERRHAGVSPDALSRDLIRAARAEPLNTTQAELFA